MQTAGAGLLLVGCCLLVPLVIGAACVIAVGLLAELALIAGAVVLVIFALQRHRSSRCGCRGMSPEAEQE
jgi:hypothetical protein